MALCKKGDETILPLFYVIIIFFFGQGFRADPRFLTARDKAYKRVVNDTSIFKVSQQPLIMFLLISVLPYISTRHSNGSNQ
jgi:hypothetical protein